MNALASGNVALSLLLAFDEPLSPGLLAVACIPSICTALLDAACTTLAQSRGDIIAPWLNDEFVRDLHAFFAHLQRASSSVSATTSGRTASTLADALWYELRYHIRLGVKPHPSYFWVRRAGSSLMRSFPTTKSSRPVPQRTAACTTCACARTCCTRTCTWKYTWARTRCTCRGLSRVHPLRFVI